MHFLYSINSIIIFLFCLSPLSAQDSIGYFSYEEFIEIVKDHHPIAYQAKLKTQQGNAITLKSKGGFDPKILGNMNQKYFDGKHYYNYLNAILKVPTWFGLTIQGGYDNNSGNYLNSEMQTPTDGLIYAGVTWDVGNGLLFDQRRAELKQARIYQSSNELERRLILNQLVYDASIAYWDWFKSVYKVEIYKETVENAQLRLNAVKQSVKFGDKPSIDTLEASIQLQNRKLYLKQESLNLVNKQANLEVFLWLEGFFPLELDASILPSPLENLQPSQPDLSLLARIDSLVLKHPEILLSENKVDFSKIDFRLGKENLKPALQLKYNVLTSQTNGGVVDNFSTNNYSFGAQLAYPIFTRKERGQLKLIELNILDQEAEIKNKQALIRYKIKASTNAWSSTYEQVQLYQNTVGDYRKLMLAESELFDIGESSVFMINSRELGLISAQINYIELLTNNQNAKLMTQYATCLFETNVK